MATQEEKELRKKVLEDIKRKRAAAAQAEGSVKAAEEGQYGDVGQGGPKGEFDDDIIQEDPNAQIEFQKFVEQNVGDKAFGLRTLGTAENILSAPSSGFGGEYDARNLPVLKDMGFVTQALFNTIAPYGEKAFDIVDTLFRLPGAAVADIAELTGSSESDVNKLQAEINTMISLIIPQGNPASTAAATNQIVNAVSKSAKELNNVRKFIPEMLEGQYSVFSSPKFQSVGAKAVDELTTAPIIQVSKTSTKVDPTAPGRSKLGTIKYGDKEMVKDQVSRYNEALEKINNLKETVFNVTADSSPEVIEAAGKAYKEIVEGSDDVLKIALGNNIKTSGYKSQGSIIQDASGINKKEFLDFKNKHPLRSGNSLNKALRLNSAVKLLEDYRKANPKSLGIEINFRKLKEILGESEEFKNIFADIPAEVLDARTIGKGKNLTREEKYIESILNNYQADFVTIEKYLSDLEFPLARPFKYRKTDKSEAAGKRLVLKLNEQQQNIFQNKRKEAQDALKEIQTIPIGTGEGMKGSEKVKDFLKTTTERMKGQGASEAEIIKAVENIDADELARLILKREEANLLKLNNLQEYDEISKIFGGNPPEESLFTYQIGHIKALEDSIESSLDMNNLMIQTQYSNQLDNQVRNYVKNKINQFNELSPDDPRDSVLRQRIIDDLDQIDEIAKEEGVFTMIEGRKLGDETKAVVKESDFPKDEAFSMNVGGIVGINKMIEPLRAQR